MKEKITGGTLVEQKAQRVFAVEFVHVGLVVAWLALSEGDR